MKRLSLFALLYIKRCECIEFLQLITFISPLLPLMDQPEVKWASIRHGLLTLKKQMPLLLRERNCYC